MNKIVTFYMTFNGTTRPFTCHQSRVAYCVNVLSENHKGATFSFKK